ncbi:hypothetical protein FW774_19960 [Pedobacter sp. BS3]|uniref:hypothetical protein n=1 Tax=Pedobacter sp. BS3 TaxID=2567937 RepID=UPI0011EFFD19|nr:hypothetical protein [Pedobacter sp. BS3]TZF80906.1 hypothetical protein FW774_19960 [Pedobacter sp. BS3]
MITSHITVYPSGKQKLNVVVQARHILQCLFLAVFLFPGNVKAQYTVLLSPQVERSVIHTNFDQLSLLAGICDSTSQILLGPLYKRYDGQYVFNNNYYGLRLYGQVKIVGRLNGSITFDIVRGTYIKYKSTNPDDAVIKTGNLINGDFGINVHLNPYLNVGLGYSPTEYNAWRYVTDKSSPYVRNSLNLKLHFLVPFKKKPKQPEEAATQ